MRVRIPRDLPIHNGATTVPESKPMQIINDKLINWASVIDANTIEQAEKTARLPIVSGHVALMPDAHLGIGATVGSVIPTQSAIIPAAVGVDIGCGMIAVETSITAGRLPDALEPFLKLVERAVPAGLGKWHAEPSRAAEDWFAKHPAPFGDVDLQVRAAEQFGTLGSGNHFFEVCLDERDMVWVVLHSGSRGVGNKLATIYIDHAKHLESQLTERLEDPNLAYLLEGSPGFNRYIEAMLWSQDYALGNREQMMNAALKEFYRFIGIKDSEVGRINCHHNFTQREEHNGVETWITRKGAIKADVGDLGVIPGSMGTRSYIVEGLGNPLSYNSCSHGAGRKMSRGEARRTFTGADLKREMGDRVWQSGSATDLVDEIPSSYKDIETVMADQADLVTIKHTLHQVFNYKGTGESKRGRKK